MARRLYFFQASMLPLISLLAPASLAIDLNTSSSSSVASVSQTIASSLFATYYNPASTAGDFTQPQPWFWWLSGSAWTTIMDYTVFTTDTTYKANLLTALAENIGENNDFIPAAQASWEANDDQAYWLYSALTALEYDFDPITPCTGAGTGANGTCTNSWLSIASNAFNVYVDRWNADSATCGGGLKWQYNPSASGYTYKNSVTNGGFFQTAARLARYTGNTTYAEWVGKIWDWSTAVGYVSSNFNVYDGAGDEDTANCTEINEDQWSYNVATYLHGAAHMYAYTGGDAAWEARVQGLVGAANATFFSPPSGNATGVMYEQNCELTSACTIDQTSFKSSLARWMAKSAMLVPSVKDDVMAVLATSAKSAAASCTDGTSGNVTCGMKWWTADGFDGYSDFGSMLSALEVVQSLLVTNAPELAKLASS
ncbi:hydrolase 76 protein [Gnomoniopsis sp. IMI 355080]|nr:hydrolase 76 protein [Gnomoniopsis sp. IMI 355080]